MELQQLTSSISNEAIRLIAGETGLKREISAVIVTDNLNSVLSLNIGEAVVSSGERFSADDSSLIDIISKLSKAGYRALFLGFNNLSYSPGKDVLQLANSIAFPVFAIAPDISANEVASMIQRAISRDKQSDFDHALSIITDVSRMSVSGESVKAITVALSSKINNTVAFANPCFTVFAAQTVDPAGSQSVFSPIKGQRLFSVSELDTIEQAVKGAAMSVYQGSILRSRELLPFILCPIKYKNALVGYLCIFATNHPFGIMEQWLCKSLVPVLGHSIQQSKKWEPTPQNIDNLFVWQVLLQQNPDIQHAKQYCALCNFDYNATRICIIIEFPSMNNDTEIHRRDVLNQIRSYLGNQLAEQSNYQKMILIHDNYLIILQTVSSSKPRISVIQEHEYICAGLVNKILDGFGLECFIGISETCRGLETLSECYFQASESIVLGKKIRPDRRWYSFHEQYLFHRLWHNFTPNELNDVCINILEPIMGNTSDMSELRRTLEMYINCNGNLSQTAELLFIHRNTLNYRMAKLKSLLAVSEISADDFTRYMVGLTILKMI